MDCTRPNSRSIVTSSTERWRVRCTFCFFFWSRFFRFTIICKLTLPLAPQTNGFLPFPRSTDELSDKNVLENLFHDIQAETNTHIVLWMKSKSNSKLRNPLVNVVGTLDGIERAKERVLSIFENIKTRVVLKMDVSYKDHSHIIGRGGFSIQRVMDDTGSHCHFPGKFSAINERSVCLSTGTK